MNKIEAQRLLAEASQTFQGGRLDEAAAACMQLLTLSPEHDGALQLLGFIHFSRGDIETAFDYLTRATHAAPDKPDAHFNLGRAYDELGRFEEAAESYRRAHACKPDDLDILNVLGRTLSRIGDAAGAEDCFRNAAALSPETAAFHVNLGNVLSAQRKFEAAAASYRKALALDSKLAPAHNGLGNALLEQGQFDAAVNAIKRALALNPDFIDARIALGNAFKAKGDPDTAAKHYHEALRRDPKNPDAHFNLAIAYLLAGRLENGWREYEWRWHWKDFDAPKRDLPQPAWRGEDPKGKAVIVWGEQGIGDEIMFAGILPDLAQAAASVTVECEPRLAPLYERSFAGIAVVPRRNPPAPELPAAQADFQLPIGSLAGLFRKSPDAFPRHDGYLKADAEKTAALRERYREMFPGKKLVGISWRSGNVELGAARTTTLDLWQPVFAKPGCAFVNLQYGEVQDEIAGTPIHDDESVDPLADVDAFAAQIAALDLVVSIDNSTVHLAGALGVPTWTLLPSVPDWRWMLERGDTPWYPAMRLFRQRMPGDWKDVFAQIADRL